jgi:hypothetical protein
MPINVFLSVGRTFTPRQEQFVSTIETHVAKKGLQPRTVGRNEFSHRRPLELIENLMDKSAGVLVIALERVLIETGLEKRGASDQTTISNETFPTPWNQIEAAFACAKRLPLMVIRETGVRPEGLLEGRYEWYVHSTNLDPAFVNTPEFNGMLDSWTQDVRRRAGWFRRRYRS